MSFSYLGTGLCVGALIFFSVATLLTRLASDRTDSALGFVVATTMNVALCAVAIPLGTFFRTGPTAFGWHAFGMFMLGGFFTTFLGRYFFFESVVRMGAARASVVGTTSSVFTALFGWILLGDRMSPASIAAMVVVLVGLALIAQRRKAPVKADQIGAQAGTGNRSDTWSTLMLIGVGSSAAYALGYIARADAVRSWNEPILGALIGAATGLALHLIVGSGRQQLARKLKEADRTGVWLYAAVGVVNITAQVLSIAAVKYVPAAEVALITNATPLLVFPASYVFLRSSEAITRNAVIGLVLALMGVGYLVGRPLFAG